MQININISIAYTQRVFDELGEPKKLGLSYASGVPLPETGDFVETDFASGIHALKVIERKFSLSTNEQRIQLILDLP
ncbi:MAG: hypothetical protein PW999_09810 [Paraburkholderia tropica]|nr:hypothetical protein [Paraburkholderia tropica]